MGKVFSYFRRMSIRTRYILSYILIMALPLMALGLVFYDNHLSDLEKSIEELQRFRMEQVRDSFDTRFEDMKEIGAVVANEYKLRPDYLLSLRSHEMDVDSLLVAYNNRNTLTSDIYLYLFANDTIYARDGSMSLDTMTDRVYAMDAGDKQWFITWLQTAENSMMQPAVVQQDGRDDPINNTLIMLYPLRSTGSRPYGVLLFFIRHETILSILANALGDGEGSAMVFDADGMPVVGTVPDGLDMASMEEALRGLAGSGVRKMESGGVSWSAIYAVSEDTGLIYTVAMPTQTLLVPVLRQKVVIFQISISVLLLGVGISVMMAWLNYRPIRGLMDEVCITAGETDSNELDAIKSSMISYIDRNRLLRQRMEQHASFVVEHVIELLLYGGITDSQAREMLREAGHDFAMPCFQVLVVDLTGAEEGRSVSEMKQAVLHAVIDLEMVNRDELRIYTVERGNENIVILLINTRESDEDGYGQSLYEQIKRGMDGPLFAGAGIRYRGTAQIQKSFVEAMAALDYIRFQKKGGMMSFDEMGGKKHDGYSYPQDELQRMMQSIKQGNADMACQSLKVIYESILASNASSMMVHCILFDIINTVAKFVVEMAPDQFVEPVCRLMAVHSLGKFYRDMQELIPLICDHVSARWSTAVSTLREQMLRYVEDHYADAELSLRSISDHFKLSIYYVSRFFSEQTSMSFKDHVGRLRIEQAKRLLTDTDLPLQDIVLRVGYVNVSSFIKKFKRDSGMTPGEWRGLSGHGEGMDVMES